MCRSKKEKSVHSCPLHKNITTMKREVKKSPKANLEPHKFTYWLMGAVCAVAFVFLSFEWATTSTQLGERQLIVIPVLDEDIDIVIPPPTPPPPPPPPPPPQPTDFEPVDEPLDEPPYVPMPTDEPVTITPPTVTVAPPRVDPPIICEPFVAVEQMPEFNGNLMQWLNRHIVYPPNAKMNGIEGRVIVGFIVEVDGSITDVQILRGTDPSLDREALRVVSQMPNWIPGKQQNTPVRVRFTIPIQFRLN